MAVLAFLVASGTFVAINVLDDEEVMRSRPSPTFKPGDAPKLDVRAPTTAARGQRLPVRAPVLPVHGTTRFPEKPQEPEPPDITFPAKIHFDRDEATPRDKRVVPRIADAIRQLPTVFGLRIAGHADDRGRPQYNLRLSSRRSCYVARELQRLLAPDVKPMRIRAYGESRPAAPNIHPDGSGDRRGRAENRRVVVAFLRREPTRPFTCPAR